MEIISSVVVKKSGIDILFCSVGAGSTTASGFQFFCEYFLSHENERS